MRTLTIGALCVSALALSACVTRVDYDGYEVSQVGGSPLRAVAALDCPDTQGVLTRTSRSADGRTCDYEGPVGEMVRLKLVALDGRSAAEVLAPSQAELRALLPVSTPYVPAVSRDEPGEHANVDLPFFHVHTVGDHADVRIFGIKIHSDGDNANVQTHLGGAHTVVHASHDGAEVIVDDVGRTNASLVYVLASDRKAASGYSAVGYVAKGPAAGPLVVGEFRATTRDGEYHRHSDNNDLDRLIDRNVRG
ncbi:hypothetical protein [Phenylobacterium sp.]|uniref:hypothetical protein n=1 Tax=Phenylobacterium sp. TaxID=1871053 RepID=UPI002C672628|nr:hypothetical protein [Phenylobacterium sp.]HLZ75631.1 hypothetical protein [Phenylobacterium sp.]